MGKITTKITNFNDGMSADIRSSSGFARLQGFKAYAHKLVPQFSTEADEGKSLDIRRFIYAPWLSATAFALFGYGVTDTSRPAVYAKGTSGGDPISETWGSISGGTDATLDSRTDTSVFFYYKGYIYGFVAGSRLWRYGKLDDTSGLAWTDTYQSIAYANLAQPLHHPADDCAYFFVDNKVYRLNGTTWDGVVLTLPSDMIITSGEADGDYLQIAAKSRTGIGNSWTFQWDRDSSLETVTAKADWGRGNLLHIANLQGVIIGVMDLFNLSLFGHSSGRIVIKALVSGVVRTVAEYSSSGFSYFDGNKFIADDKLHFAAEIARDGGYMHGVYSVDALGQLRLEISEPEADGITGGLRYQGIYKTGEYWWLAHSGDGSVNRTNDQNVYGSGIVETNLISGPTKLSLLGATVPCEALASGASVVLKWRKQGETSWTTVSPTKTPAAGDTVVHFLKDSNGKAPRGDELQYRIESSGGAVITATEEDPIVFLHETDDQKAYG